MNIAELKQRCPRLYAQVFAAGVASARRQALAAELIVTAAESQPQINSPLATLARSQEARERGARAMLLRAEIAGQLAL
jgi:hypothetical protein